MFSSAFWQDFFSTDNLMAMLQSASLDSLYMVSVSSLATVLLGIPLGVVLIVTRKNHILGNLWRVGKWLGVLINMVRSVPFTIFIVWMIPLTKALVGFYLGPTAVILPLTLAAVVFMARLAENAMLEVPYGVIEAAQSAGASSWQIIWHVLLPEARPGLVQAVTVMVITLIGYSAMAGTVGGGGLGDLALRLGFHRYKADVMLATVIILVIAVQAIQSAGDAVTRKVDKR